MNLTKRRLTDYLTDRLNMHVNFDMPLQQTTVKAHVSESKYSKHERNKTEETLANMHVNFNLNLARSRLPVNVHDNGINEQQQIAKVRANMRVNFNKHRSKQLLFELQWLLPRPPLSALFV